MKFEMPNWLLLEKLLNILHIYTLDEAFQANLIYQ